MMGYLVAIWRSRYFWLSLVRNDLRARYRGSILGIGWSLLSPLAMTLILCAVFRQFFAADLRAFAPYVFTGLACWQFIAGATTLGCSSLLASQAYVRQYPAPLAIFPLRTTLGALIHFLITLSLAVTATWVFQGPGSLFGLLGLVPAVVVVFLFAWALAIIVGLANVYFRDVQYLVEISLQLLFYATPVFYPPSLLRDSGLDWLLTVNPFVPFLSLIREPILEGRFGSLAAHAQAAGTSLAFLILAGLMLARFQRRVVFHL